MNNKKGNRLKKNKIIIDKVIFCLVLVIAMLGLAIIHQSRALEDNKWKDEYIKRLEKDRIILQYEVTDLKSKVGGL